MALTDARVKAARLPEGKKQMKMADGGGLYLLVSPAGKYWRLAYRFEGKQRTLAMGVYPQVTLKEARDYRAVAKRQIAEGIDPSQFKQRARRNHTIEDANAFETVARAWLDHVSIDWAEKTKRTHAGWMEADIYPVLGRIAMDDITTPDIVAILRQVEKEGHDYKLRKMHSIFRRVFSYAISHGKASRNPVVNINVHDLFRPERRQNRPAFTTAKDAGRLMRMISGYDKSPIVRDGLLLLAYTFVRPGELRQMRWEEIDWERSQWRYHVTKTDVDHVVPLASQAVEVLKRLRAITYHSEFVLPGHRSNKRPLSDAAFSAALRAMGVDTKNGHCPHGFRAMARTLLAEQGWNTDYIERQLCHKEKDATVAAYAREKHIPERTKMMQAWANYLDGLRDGAEVIPFRRQG